MRVDELVDVATVLKMSLQMLQECESMLLTAYRLTGNSRFEGQASSACAVMFYLERALQQEYLARCPIEICAQA